MSETFDWSKIPCYNINYGDLENPADICSIFARYNIDKYVYRVKFKGIVIKYGMSAPNSATRMWGERLYRQLAHCYSWAHKRIDGSSGADWVIIERDFKQLYGIDIDHKHVSVTVWDVTNYEFESFNPALEVEKMEAELICNYIDLMGEKPIGNLNDEANKRNKHFVSTKSFNNLFA